MVLQLDRASESPGRRVNIQIAGPHPQSFGLLSSEMWPENLHVRFPAGADASGRGTTHELGDLVCAGRAPQASVLSSEKLGIVLAPYFRAIVRMIRDGVCANALYHVSCKELLGSGNVICAVGCVALAL